VEVIFDRKVHLISRFFSKLCSFEHFLYKELDDVYHDVSAVMAECMVQGADIIALKVKRKALLLSHQMALTSSAGYAIYGLFLFYFFRRERAVGDMKASDASASKSILPQTYAPPPPPLWRRRRPPPAAQMWNPLLWTATCSLPLQALRLKRCSRQVKVDA